MATFKTGAIPASLYLTQNKSSWNHATNIGRLRYSFGRRLGIVQFPSGQGWWAMRNNGDSFRFVKQLDLEEDRIRLDIGAGTAGEDSGADLSDNFELRGQIGIIANGQTFKYDLLAIDRSDKYNLVISANFQSAWQTFIENQILTRNPYRGAQDVRDIELVVWDGQGTSPFVSALPNASAPAVGVNAIADGNEGDAVQVSATEAGGLYDTITRTWSASKGTITQDDEDAKLAQWTRPQVTSASEKFNVVYTVEVTGTGDKAKSATTDSASASHSATVNNVLSAATAPDTVIIDVAKLVEQDAGHTVKLTATVTGGTYDDLQYQWRVKHNGYIPQRDISDTALDGTDLATPTLTYPEPPATSTHSQIQVELTVTAVGDGTLADANTTAVASATSVEFRSWHPVALPDWAATPLGVLDSDDVHLASAQEGHDVRLFAIRKGGTGRFDDVEIDWEWSHEIDDMNNRVWLNLDDAVDDDPFAWTLPTVDVDTPIFIRARYRVTGSGTNARNGTQTGWGSWQNLQFTVLTFHVKAPSTVDLTLTHNSGPEAGSADTTFEAGSTVRMTATYASDGKWDDRDFVWGYIHNDNAVINAATSAVATSAIITMPNPTESSGDWDIWMYLEVVYKGSGTNARSGTSVTKTYYIKDVVVRYPRPSATSPTTITIQTAGVDGVPEGDEGTAVTVGVTVDGGKYDAIGYVWSYDDGTDTTANASTDAEYAWTRPQVDADTGYSIHVTVTVEGDGTTAKDGTTASTKVTATTRVLDIPVPTDHLRLGSVVVSSVYLGAKECDVYLGVEEIL